MKPIHSAAELNPSPVPKTSPYFKETAVNPQPKQIFHNEKASSSSSSSTMLGTKKNVSKDWKFGKKTKDSGRQEKLDAYFKKKKEGNEENIDSNGTGEVEIEGGINGEEGGRDREGGGYRIQHQIKEDEQSMKNVDDQNQQSNSKLKRKRFV